MQDQDNLIFTEANDAFPAFAALNNAFQEYSHANRNFRSAQDTFARASADLDTWRAAAIARANDVVAARKTYIDANWP